MLWTIVLGGMHLLTTARRWTGGRVMTDNAIFVPYAGLLAIGIVWQGVLLWQLRRANRSNVLLPRWLWPMSGVFDLAVAAGVLGIASFLSPRGPVPAMSAPALLLLPLIVLMSVLQMRPVLTLGLGISAAAIHVLLALRAIVVTDAPHEAWPVYLGYGFVLALTAVVGTFVARAVRAHVREAAQEAAAHARSERQVFDMQRDLAVARDIQLHLLPARSPPFAGFEIVGMNRPADLTGGDYYDWQAMPDGKLAVVLADVAGHGIGPSLVMAVCRAYARAAAPILPDPSALLKRLNDLLHDDLPDDRFITLVLALLDESGAAQLISAGHGPTFFYRAATGAIAQFGGDGIPLGVMQGEEYGPATPLAFDRGDVLLLISDGFFEWCRPCDRQAFGIARLQHALLAHASLDAAGILRSIEADVRQFCDGSPQSDDMTAIVIKRTAPAAAPLRDGGLPRATAGVL